MHLLLIKTSQETSENTTPDLLYIIKIDGYNWIGKYLLMEDSSWPVTWLRYHPDQFSCDTASNNLYSVKLTLNSVLLNIFQEDIDQNLTF